VSAEMVVRINNSKKPAEITGTMENTFFLEKYALTKLNIYVFIKYKKQY
jgi:hypothetical protein